MKKLLFLLLPILFLFSCSKENEMANNFTGEWVAGQDSTVPVDNNMIYDGFFKDTTTVVRKIFTEGSQIKIIMLDAPYKETTGSISNNKLICDTYFTETNTQSNCTEIRIRYINIEMKIQNDTLIETGNYIVYYNTDNGFEEVRYATEENVYTAKFVKRIIKPFIVEKK